MSRVLYDIIRQQYSSIEDTVQAAQALYRISQPHSREQKQAISTLIHAQNDILSYMFHTPLRRGSEEIPNKQAVMLRTRT